MMTEKERRAALNDESNYFYTRRFPYRDGDPVKITVFEYHGLNIYKLDMYQMLFDWEEHYATGKESYVPGWKRKFWFVDDKEGTVRCINDQEADDLMREAEKREKQA